MLFLFSFPAQLAALALGLALIGPLTRRRPVPPWASAVLGLGVAAMAAMTLYLSDPPLLFEDFAIAYYPAGAAALGDPATLAALIGKGVYGFVNLPAIALLFVPLAQAPLSVATVVFAALGAAAVVAAWALLARAARLETPDRWRLALLFAANGPLAYSLKEGNTSHFVLLALAAALSLLRRDRSGWAGAALAAAALLKPPLVVLGGVFLLRRDRRGAAVFAAVGAGAAALSLALYGWPANLHWLRVCILGSAQLWLGAFNVQSAPAFLLRLTAPAAVLMRWTSSAPPPGMATLAHGWIVLLLITATAACCAPARSQPSPSPASAATSDWRYVLLLSLALLATPLAWSHYYCWLLPAAALFLGERASWSAGERRLGWTAATLVGPLSRILPITGGLGLLVYKDLGVSHYLLGGALWFALAAWRLVRPEPRRAGLTRRGSLQMTWRAKTAAGSVAETRLPERKPIGNEPV
jgi:hypothetical protein